MPWDTCTPRRKIAFAKTHKTASSTVQNILLRYGLKNGAEFLLPWVNNYLGNMLKPFTVEQMDRADQTKVPWHRTLRKSPGGYDISCFHCKWNDTAMRYKFRLQSRTRVWCILFLLWLTTSASTFLKNSRKLGTTL